jgi:hypothetical protein
LDVFRCVPGKVWAPTCRFYKIYVRARVQEVVGRRRERKEEGRKRKRKEKEEGRGGMEEGGAGG